MTRLSPAEALETHLTWSEGPWLGFVFAPSDASVRALRAQVPGPDGEQVFRPTTPQQLREGVPRLLGGPSSPLTWVLAPPDALPPRPDGSSPWGEAIDWFLMRANERRQPLLDHLGGGLLLVLPTSYRRRAPEAAPDLWSARALALDLPHRPAPPPLQASPPVDRRVAALLRRLAFQQRMRTDPWHARVQARDPAHRALVQERVRRALPGLVVREGGDDTLWIGVEPGEASPSLTVDLDRPLPLPDDGPALSAPPLPPSDPLAEVDATLRAAAATWSQGWASETLELADRATRALQGAATGPDRDRRLATALELAGRARRELGDRPGALEALDRAIPLRRRLGALHGADGPGRRRELARALSLRGQLLLEGPDLDRARADLEAALALRRALVAWSDDPEGLAELALSHSLLADAHEAGDPPALGAAEAERRAALALRRRIVEQVDAPRHHRQLGLAWGRLGRLLARQLRLSEAERAWSQAVAEAAAVTAASALPVHRMEESVARTQLAAVRWQRGDRDGARREVERAIAQRRQLLADDPANARWAERLAVALGQAAQQALDEGDGARARAWAEEAVAVGEQLVPATASQLRGLALAHLRLGDVHAALGAPQAAERCWRQAEALLPALDARSPERAASVRESLALRRR